MADTATPPAGTARPDILEIDAGHFDSLLTQGSGTVLNRKGVQLKTYQQAIADISGLISRGDWVTATNYALRDLVKQSGVTYICLEGHLSGTFSTDLAAGKWAIYQGVSGNELSASSGAALVGANDGASGSLFTTVAGFIARVLSSAGSSVVGYVSDFVGAVSRTVEAKLREKKSLADFGAVGDYNPGTGTGADDTTAIQNAFNWLGSGPFRTLEFVHGAKHKTTSPLSMTSSWTARQCLIEANNAQIFSAHGGVCLDLSAFGISGLKHLNLVRTVPGTGTAIYARPNGAQYAGQSLFSTINVQDFDVGLYWGSATAGANGGWSTNFIDLDISTCNTGIHLADGGNNALTFVGLRSASNDIGVLIDGSCYGVKFVGGAIEFNAVAGVRFGGTAEKFGISFDGVYMENPILDFDILAGTTNLRNWTVENGYIFSNSAGKVGVCSVGAGSSASGVKFANNFIYHSATSNYGQLPDGTILDNNYAPFEQAVGGSNLIYRDGYTYTLPAGAAGAAVFVDTNQTAVRTQSFSWVMYHDNNDGSYTFSGHVVVSQVGDPKTSTTIALKSAPGGAAAGGTCVWSASGGFLRFTYTPPGGVTTSGTSTLTLRRA